MRKWEQKRAEEISEYILVTHIVSLLIFLMVVSSFYSLPLGLHLPIHLQSILTALVVVIIVYVGRKLLSRITFLDQPQIDEILLLAVIFPVAFIFLWHSRGFFGAKVLILIPSIIASTGMGKLWGVATAALASSLVFFLDYRLHSRLPLEIFQTDSIITCVNLLLTWLVGGLMEAEQKTQQELLQLADYDQLTGLYNHRHLQEKLALTLQKAAAENLPVSLALLDIEQFKYFNAIYGYQKGDEVLADIGQLLQEEIKEPCYAARYGGDEFALVFPGKEKREAAAATSRIHTVVSRAIASLIESEKMPSFKRFTIATGLASYPADADGVLSLVRAAEDDLYRAKYARGATYLYYSILGEISTLKVKDAFPTLRTLVALINIKDRYTFGHSERVMSYSSALAEKLSLSEEEKDTLRYGAYLHDLGKIEVESAILNKAGSLTEEEWEVMKKHTVLGSEIVRPLLFFQDISPIIRSHHENYDGTGYPDGLKGEEIPLLARIVRLADSFDAMTTDRPYRKALTFSQACQELRKNAGKHYDPYLVDLFLEAVSEVYEKQKTYY
jgi:diguanylate cyclase (GGDEF)-like protein/putative nucleotidyltransferase with HDIG domain